jgi:hypothetical protein
MRFLGMKHLLTPLAGGFLALTWPAPSALASIETPQARMEASFAAEIAYDHLSDTFGARSLSNGKYLWRDNAGKRQVDRVVISLSNQLAFAYAGDELVGVSTISSGKKGKETPTGIFSVLDKQRTYFSKKYDNAPMPYMQRIDQYGIALHAGHLPGRPASHGCVRLPKGFASKLFAATKVGTEVLIGS